MPDCLSPTLTRAEAKKFEKKVKKGLKALDHQEGGTHYKQFQIEPLEFLARNRIPFTEGNIVKYVCRHRFKGGLEDLKKAMHYLQVLIETEYGDA